VAIAPLDTSRYIGSLEATQLITGLELVLLFLFWYIQRAANYIIDMLNAAQYLLCPGVMPGVLKTQIL
jgi:hypothetical protein